MKNITKFIEKQQVVIEKQKILIEKLQTSDDKQERAIEKQNREIQSIIPLGFLYTQFPHQSPPLKLWPNMKWSEVTHQYSGLFFRAEGGGSEPFGRTQSANYSTISTIAEWSWDRMFSHTTGPHLHQIRVGWSEALIQDFGFAGLKVFMTSAENRPRNIAIRIWKRIQ